MITFMSLAVLMWIIWDTFGNTLVYGTPLAESLRAKWGQRIDNLNFRTKMSEYKNIIHRCGELVLLNKETLKKVDGQEYVKLQVFKKDRVIEMEYSMNSKKINVDIIHLKDLKKRHRDYGDWMNKYIGKLLHAKTFDGDFQRHVNEMITLALDKGSAPNMVGGTGVVFRSMNVDRRQDIWKDLERELLKTL